jgi:uncharacterized protein (DUF2342 family)
MTDVNQAAAHLQRLFDEQLAGAGPQGLSAPDAASVSHRDGIERIPVRVSILVGDQAHIVTDAGTERIPVSTLIEATGIPRDRLPGRRITALVRNGELAGFAPE